MPDYRVKDIQIGHRFRKDAQDIESLAASIAECGLLQPIAIWPDGTLACGWRRLLAVKSLGWETVAVHVLTGLDDLISRLRAERDENTCRREFRVSEAVALGMALEPLEAEEARKRQAHGQTAPGKNASGNFPEASSGDDAGQTRDKVGEAIGVSGKTYEKAKAVVVAATEEPEVFGDLVEEMDETGKVDRAHRKMQERKKSSESAQSPIIMPVPAHPVLVEGERYKIEQVDCLNWFSSLPDDSLDLVFGSPPYEDARLYLEDGVNMGIARKTEDWVVWMLEVFEAALRCCRGLVAFVVDGRTEDYEWTASPALLIADLKRKGIAVRRPPIYQRVGIPGSGGPDWLRNDYEFIVCATRCGKLPWSNNTAMGEVPKFDPGGKPSHRTKSGRRVNQDGESEGYATMEERSNLGPHRARRKAGYVYKAPEVANPGNIIRCSVGGGNMGDELCHENEAPFPERLAEFFVRSFCPPGGVVADPFCGSGTTAKMALTFGRRFTGCDMRASQVRLTQRRLESIQETLFKE